MSALGQKQTFALHQPMSALPPKADMCSALAYVCFGPKAHIPAAARQFSILNYSARLASAVIERVSGDSCPRGPVARSQQTRDLLFSG
jgi:hypothetical protein